MWQERIKNVLNVLPTIVWYVLVVATAYVAGYIVCQYEMRVDAVKNNKATWVVTDVYGNTRFEWK
jgi:hypothetical protein